jgi:hypothetical protein
MAGSNKYSGLRTADAVFHSGVRSILAGVQVITDGTNEATLVITDASSGTTASGTNELFKAVVPAGEDTKHFSMPAGGVRAEDGLSCNVSGTGAAYIIYFR